MILVELAGAWLLGIAAGAIFGGVWWPALAAIGAAGLAASALERRPWPALVALLAAGLFVAGTARYLDQRPPDDPGGVAAYNQGSPVRLRALVSGEPELRGRTQRLRLDAREVLSDGRWQQADGGVLLRTGLFPRYEYGDVLELEGALETPPSFPDFDYRDYLARQGIVSLIAYAHARVIATGEGSPAFEALYALRGHLGETLARVLPEPQAALAQGILIGQRSAIPPDLTADLNATGTSHLIAISGYNVSLVAAFVIGGLAWLLGRRRAAIGALVVIAAYTMLTGASPTVVRAAIMGGLLVVATLAGRPASAATSIALAAALMTGWDPPVIEDVSFQLSFAAIAGLVYLSPPLHERGARLLAGWGVEGGVAGFLLENTAVTAGAVLATLPLFALYFDRLSLVTFAANLLLVPAFPAVMGASALAAVAGGLWAPLGWPAWAALTYLIETARFFAGLPLASVGIGRFGAGHAAVAFVALAAFGWWLNRRPRERADEPAPGGGARLRPAWLLGGALAIAAAIAWWAAFGALRGDDGRLTMTVLDVGQGDAILIEAPDGRHVLIDGGPDGRRTIAELSDELPFWDRTIDLVVLTHGQEDHVAGLVDVLERYDVREVLTPPLQTNSPAYLAWRDEIDRQAIPAHIARAGDVIDLGDGATLRVLGPTTDAVAAGGVNDASVVLKLSMGNVSFLLTADIEIDGEEALLRSGAAVGAQVLKVAHHGSATSTSPAFLRAVEPAVSVVSVGQGNRYGHPSPSVVERLGGTLLLRTDQDGTVRLETDGHHLWVDKER